MLAAQDIGKLQQAIRDRVAKLDKVNKSAIQFFWRLNKRVVKPTEALAKVSALRSSVSDLLALFRLFTVSDLASSLDVLKVEGLVKSSCLRFCMFF
jgi:hypothetical protein